MRCASTPNRNPGDGFRPVDSSLEDVYFLNLAATGEELIKVKETMR